MVQPLIIRINGYNTYDKLNENFRNTQIFTFFLQLTFEENMENFDKHLLDRGYPTSVVEKHLFEVKFSDREASLKLKNRDAREEYIRNTTCLCPT